MEFAVLGTVEARIEGVPVPLGGPKQRALLALLLLDANRPVSRDRLIEGLWAESPPARADASLDSYVSRLRRALGHDRLERRPPGYALAVEPGELDVDRFEGLLADAGAATGRRRSQLLQQALVLWRGPALGEFAGEPFAQTAIARLEELRLGAFEQRFEAELELGHYTGLLAELEGFVSDHPLRERPRGQLMLALYRSGRQAESLQVYRKTRDALVQGLGIEPSRALSELEQRILRHDSTLDLPHAAAAHTHPSLIVPAQEDEPVARLPVAPNALLGRDRELNELRELLLREDVRLLVLSGAGGAGKTRLALEVARQTASSFANGAAFVNLAPLRDPELVGAEISRVLGVREAAGAEPFETLVAAVRTRELLLLVDNAEHLRAAAPLFVELIAAAPGLTVLVTSRVVLHLSGEHVYLVEPLAEDAATALFSERARDASTYFSPDEADDEAIRLICDRLDGLPLAIELAASRTRVLTPVEMLARLDSRLPLLTRGPRDLPVRQQTLRATLDWTVDLLDEDGLPDLMRLAVFAGGCTLAAAEAVGGTTVERLSSLIEHNLLRRTSTTIGSRYSMLETIREFALERLANSGETNEVQRRHAEYFLARAERLSDVIVEALKLQPLPPSPANSESRRRESSPSERERCGKLEELGVRRIAQLAGLPAGAAADGFEPDDWPLPSSPSSTASESPLQAEARLELANFRSALEWCIENALTEWSLRFVTALSWPLFRSDAAIEAMTWAERALALSGEVDLRVRARALEAAGALTTHTNELDRASDLLTESLRLFRQFDDTFWVGVLLDGLADLDLAAGRLQAARARYEESLAVFSDLTNEHGIAAAQFGLGVTQRDLGAARIARPILASAVRTFRELHDSPALAAAAHSLGDLELDDGNLNKAENCYRESLTLARDAKLSRWHIAHCLGGLAGVASCRGDIQRAGRLWGAVETFEAFYGIKLHSPDRGRYQRRIARVTGPAFDAAVAVGRRLTMSEAIAYALSPN
jgi:predicted ATPase/DNA-binding SARP family transcriptional activator